MKNLVDYINEAIKVVELTYDASESECKKFAKKLVDTLNAKYHLDVQWDVDDMLDALNRLDKENYPIHISDFGLNDDSYLAFDNLKNALQFNDKDGWIDGKIKVKPIRK